MKHLKLACLALALILTVGIVTAIPAAATGQTLTAKLTPTSVKVGKTAHIKGNLVHAAPKALLRLQSYYRGAWHNYKALHLTPPAITFDFSIPTDSAGVYPFRVLSPSAASKHSN